MPIFSLTDNHKLSLWLSVKSETYRNEIKSYIVRTGMTMMEVVDYLSDEYGWSRSVPNLSGKLKRSSLRYGGAVELADALGYDIVWQKRRKCDRKQLQIR